MSLNAVLFDLDGTLLDTLADIASAMNQTLAKHDLPVHPVLAYRQFVGSGTRELVIRASGRSGSGDDVDAMVADMHEAYGNNLTDQTRPYEGIATTLAELSRHGIAMAILSNKDDRFVQEIVAKVLPDVAFDHVMGLQPEFAAKPDPASALEIARRMGIPPSDVLFLGDSDVDMVTAIRAGMHAVGASWGFRGADELRRAGAAAIVESPEDILKLMNGRVGA